jgi:hypothetical protein
MHLRARCGPPEHFVALLIRGYNPRRRIFVIF